MNNTSEKLAKAPLTKLMFSLSIPTIVAQLINILYNIVDRMYIGRMPEVGAIALTGLGVCAPIITIVSSLSMLIGGGGAPLAAISLGAKDKNKAEKILGTSTFALLIMGLVVTALFLVFKDPLLITFGASEASLPYASTYLEIYLYGTVFVQISLGLNSFISSQGKTMIAMLTVLIGAVLNIIFDPILIYTFNMGVAGAAWATIFSQFVSAIFVFGFLASKKSEIRIKKTFVKFNKRLLSSICALGVSSFVMAATEAAIVVIFNRGLLKYGSDMHVGAMAIIQSVMMMIFMPVSGFKQGVLPIISYNYGANNIKRVRETIKKTLAISWSFTAIFSLFVYIFPQVFASVFTT
ncbi:MAG: MATE family efflux transporter, partial [Christensenellaceae bacterium]|nr:MATE family efflux transporter [Christensenellaceae bacterium]